MNKLPRASSVSEVMTERDYFCMNLEFYTFKILTPKTCDSKYDYVR